MFVSLTIAAGGVALATGLFSLPGDPIDTQLGSVVVATRTGTATIDVGTPPVGATDISLALTCLTAGSFDFPNGSLVLTEAGTKRRASLHVLKDEAALAAADPGGIDVFAADLEAFRAALTAENRTLKRALTDPRILSGIGNAYSDEVLHAAMLSPVTLTHKLTPEEWNRLYTATRDTLHLWVDRLRNESRAAFPEKVTAFRPEMAVHGRYGKPCPRCGEPVQRIRYADNETNYCARCQTEGRVLADRALSRLLGADWPRTLDELEALKRR
jgi:formamidopyrimidine-DNA glycosylase